MANLVIQGSLPNLNDYIKACRTNRYVGAKMKHDIENIVTQAIKEQIPNVHFDGTVELNFKWFEKNRRRDLDNISASKKFILDALVSNRTIVADGWKGVIGFTDEFFIDSQNPRIEVEIMKGEKYER